MNELDHVTLGKRKTQSVRSATDHVTSGHLSLIITVNYQKWHSNVQSRSVLVFCQHIYGTKLIMMNFRQINTTTVTGTCIQKDLNTITLMRMKSTSRERHNQILAVTLEVTHQQRSKCIKVPENTPVYTSPTLKTSPIFQNLGNLEPKPELCGVKAMHLIMPVFVHNTLPSCFK